jgi:hypothetical protein
MTLSMLTPSGAVGLEGSAVAAAQPADMGPPPPGPRVIGTPPTIIFVFWLGVIASMVYIATHEHHNNPVLPNSPA